MRKELVFIGEGGQGIVLMGHIFAKAVQLDGREVAFVPSYGAAARGGKCASSIVVSDGSILFPGVMSPDILVAMSQEGYNYWISKISSESKVLFDPDTVRIIQSAVAPHVPAMAIKIASGLGSKMAANMVMLGSLAAITEMVSAISLSEAVKKESGKFADINLKALEEGCKINKR
ncbi:MAG: 2-oxoacid:acceptor oxidoreductase family protein [Candidatus Nealsonbacteria bacterium]|nr:2-oxoacid:acceptor oxidoreductase family protein [Candidatus Nealsonbacteria bacterium]